MYIVKFVLMEHVSKKSNLHQDLRFRRPDSTRWASFAIPKKIPLEPGKKNLAIRTPDHSRKGALYTGRYKDGEIKKIDEGDCELIKFESTFNHLVIKLKGNNIKGMYHILKYKNPDKYFIFKSKIE